MYAALTLSTILRSDFDPIGLPDCSGPAIKPRSIANACVKRKERVTSS